MPRIRAETLYALVIVLFFAGLSFAIYAGYETVNPAAQGVCSISPFFSCAKIDHSGHTTIAGVPDWAIGIAGYVVLLGLGLVAYSTFKRQHLLALTAVSGLGVALSAYLAYLELAVIQGLCPICLGAYLCNLGAFLVLVRLVRLGMENDGASDPTPAPASVA